MGLHSLETEAKEVQRIAQG